MKRTVLPRHPGAATLALIVLLVPLGIGGPPGASADAEESPAQLEEQLRVIREWKHKQAEVIRKMREELARNPDHPDTSKLEPLSTAGGYRSEAYRKAPDYIQKKIEEFYAPLPAGDALALALGMANPRAQYVVEIARSERLIKKYLEPEERRVEGRIEALRREAEARQQRAPQATLDHRAQQEANLARLDEMVSAMRRQIQPLRAEASRVDGARQGAAGLYRKAQDRTGRALALVRQLEGAAAQLKQASARCKDAAALRQRLAGQASQAEQHEQAVARALDGAEKMAGTCRTQSEANNIKALYDNAEQLTARIGLVADRARTENDAATRLLMQGQADRQAARQAASASKAVVNARVESSLTEVESLAVLDQQVSIELANRKEELRRSLERLRGAFPTDDPTVTRKLQDVLGEIDAVGPREGIDGKHWVQMIQLEEHRLGTVSARAAQLIKELDGPSPCDGIPPAEDALDRAEAAYTGALIHLGAAGPLPQRAADCLARSQPPLPVSTGLPQPARTDPGKSPPSFPVSFGLAPPAPGANLSGAPTAPPPAPAAAGSPTPPTQPAPPPAPVSYSAQPPPPIPRGPAVPGFEDLPLVTSVPRVPRPVEAPPVPERGKVQERAAPLAARILGPTAPVEVNQIVVLRPDVRGGREPYRYRWEVGGNAVEGPEARLRPHAPGERTIRLTVWDREGHSASATSTMVVRDSRAAAQAVRDRQAAEQARLQREKELRELRASMEQWRKDLACLEEGKRKYPRIELNCNGNFLIGSRDGHIERLRRNIRDAEKRLAAAR